jgi:hypothetical protein
VNDSSGGNHDHHNTCSAPGCATFHLFCSVCAGRHHLADDAANTPVVARNSVPWPVSAMAAPAGTKTA